MMPDSRNYTDTLDRLLLARGIWFRLTFDDYIAMRLVCKRWRRMYLEMKRAAKQHFLRHAVHEWAGGSTEYQRYFLDRDGNRVQHGRTILQSGTFNSSMTSYRLRFGKYDGWTFYTCGRCNHVLRCLEFHRDGHHLFNFCSDDGCDEGHFRLSTVHVFEFGGRVTPADRRLKSDFEDAARTMGLEGAYCVVVKGRGKIKSRNWLSFVITTTS